MHLPENAAALLAQTLTRLLGAATPGSMAFVRCLPAAVVRNLVADTRFVVPNWRIAAVTGTPDETQQTITADVAVEWREDTVRPRSTFEATASRTGSYVLQRYR